MICSDMTSGPPTWRRSTASSSSAHTEGGRTAISKTARMYLSV